MNKIFNKSCYGLTDLSDNSIDCILTDPPYGINIDERWDQLPDPAIWSDCLRVLKPGGFLATFSAIKYQHLFTQQLIEAGFEFKDVLLWVFLNGRVSPIDADKVIDKELGVERNIAGKFKYKQGVPNANKSETYKVDTVKHKTVASSLTAKDWEGFGRNLKTMYEPIIIMQKPFDGDFAQNLIKWGVGGLDLETTRIPYDLDEAGTIGHNPHPYGRVMGNVIQIDDFGDYQKFFFVGKVRDGKKTNNIHPTVKPEKLMELLVSLLSRKDHVILDPFMGSGTTAVAAFRNDRQYVGYELQPEYIDIINERIENEKKDKEILEKLDDLIIFN